MKAVLLSGGMDSIALTHWKRPELAFTVDYGQAAASAEIAAARQVAGDLGIRHEIVRVDCTALGSGDMADAPPADVAPVSDWWPYRNQLILTLAGMRGIAIGVTELMLGSVASDGVHADGRAEFFSAMDRVMALQEGTVRVTAPALHLSTVELVRISDVPASLLAWAHSCHAGPVACGACRGCVKHFEVTGELTGFAY